MKLMTIAELAEETGLSENGIKYRLQVHKVRAQGRRSYWSLYPADPRLLKDNIHLRGAYVVEDLEWMVADDVGMTEALTRLGYTHQDSLERLLYRANRADLIVKLKRNEVAA